MLELAYSEHKCIALPLYKMVGWTAVLLADIMFKNQTNGDSDRCNKNFSYIKSRRCGTFKVISSKKYDNESSRFRAYL